MLNLAVSAVAVFFVLSGFVIRLITTVRPVTPRDYAVDRFSRIYSVTLPAVLFTCAVALLLHLVPSARLDQPVEFNLKTISAQSLANLSFTGSNWGLDFPISFNGVFWSLCYECAYYCFYGLAFFAKGWVRWVSLTGMALFVGPPILILLPLWLFGCAIHDVYQRLRGRRHALSYVTGVLAALGLMLMLLRHSLSGLTSAAATAGERMGLMRLDRWSRAHDIHLLQRASFHAYVVGVPTGLLVLWLLLLVERVKLHREHPAGRVVRLIADGTFALYLFHLPLLMLIVAFVPYDRASSAQKICVLAVVIVLSVLIERPLDWLKRLLRRWLSMSRSASRSVVSVQ